MTYIYNYPINFNIQPIGYKPTFQAYPATILRNGDSFATNPLYKNSETLVADLEREAKTNPRIREIMSKYNLPIKVNGQVLSDLQNGHLQDTRVIAAQIYSSLPKEMKAEVNLPNLQEAAMLHDYGKALIPREVLEKQASLTPYVREIIEQHAELGYELLKNKDVNPETLNLIKYHHQTPTFNGYPVNNNNFEYGLSAEILNTADKYSALREVRSYKNSLTQQEALQVISNEVSKGNLSPEVYNALKKGVN